MKKVLLVLLALTSVTAFADVERRFRDLRLPSQVMLEKQSFGAPAAASTNDIKSAFAGATSAAAVTLSSFLAQPDVPRNIVITPGGSTGDVASCDVVVNGTNYYGSSISETFSFAANASTATTGAKAFKTVSSVVFPANCEDSPYAATWSIGSGEKIGLKNCLANAGDWVFSEVGGAYESTRATLAVDVDEVEKNTADFNGTMNGSNAFLGFFIQNYRCHP